MNTATENARRSFDFNDLTDTTRNVGQQKPLAARNVVRGMRRKRAFLAAATLVAACEGAVILARAERSFEPFDLVAAEQLAMIKAATKAGS